MANSKIEKIKFNEEEFIDELISRPEWQELNEVERLKLIYVELGKRRTFNSIYHWGSEKEQKKVYAKAKESKFIEQHVYTKVSPDGTIKENLKKGIIICYSLARETKRILTNPKLGYKCDMAYHTDNEHVFNVVTLKDGRKIQVDIQEDLVNIQTGLRTENFGEVEEGFHTKLDQISEEEQDEIDRKIGYPNSIGKHNNDILEKEINYARGLPKLNDKISYILGLKKAKGGRYEQNPYCMIHDLIKDAGNDEILLLFYSLVKQVRGDNEKGLSANTIPCIINREDGGKAYTNCIVVHEDKKDNIYFYLSGEKRYEKIGYRELDELIQEGLELEPRSKGAQLLNTNLKVWKKKMQGRELKRLRNHLSGKEIAEKNDEEIYYDEDNDDQNSVKYDDEYYGKYNGKYDEER